MDHMPSLYFDASVLQHETYRGVHIYALNLLRHMAEVERSTQLHLHLGMDGWNPAIDALAGEPNIRMHRHPGRVGRHVVTPFNIWRTRSRAYCLLNGNTGKIRVPVPCPTAAIFHDMRLVLRRDIYGDEVCDRFTRDAREWLPRLDLVITGSQTVRAEILAFFGIKPERVIVASEGPGHQGAAQVQRCPSSVPAQAAFFLTVNPSDIRKNLRLVLDGFAHYVADHPEDAETLLVIAGIIAEDGMLTRWLASETRAARRVVRLGFVTEEELGWLYRHAIASVYVSRYEGFGIPIIESLSHECPVIASNIPVFHEVAGDTAIYVDCDDAPALASAMRLLKEDHGQREVAIGRGTQQVSRYSWHASAIKVREALLSL